MTPLKEIKELPFDAVQFEAVNKVNEIADRVNVLTELIDNLYQYPFVIPRELSIEVRENLLKLRE